MPSKKTPAKRPAPPLRVPKSATPEERIPRVIEDPTLDDHLEIIAKAVFQAGLSWAFIDARWDTYRAAFHGFALDAVASYGEADLERIAATDGVMKSRAKIAAIVHNARALREAAGTFGSIRAYHASFATFDDARKDAKKRFSYMGDLNVYYWRFRTGAPVPPLEVWLEGQASDHPRIREMVLLGRAQNRSSERA